jgi:hypothetical protein
MCSLLILVYVQYSAVCAFKQEVEGITYVKMFAVSFYKTENNLFAYIMYDKHEITITTLKYDINLFSLPNCKHFL